MLPATLNSQNVNQAQVQGGGQGGNKQIQLTGNAPTPVADTPQPTSLEHNHLIQEAQLPAQILDQQAIAQNQ